MRGRPRWPLGVVVAAALVLAGCRTDPYAGWPEPATLTPICEQYETTDETIFEAIRPEQGGSWDEARAAAAELEAVVLATELPPSEVTPGIPFPDLPTAASSLRRGVEEAAQMTDPIKQLQTVYGPVEQIDPLADTTIDAKRHPDLAFVAACDDRDLGDDRRPLEPFQVAGLVALGGAAIAWLGTRRRREPAARTAHTVLGGVLLGTVAGIVVLWGIGVALFVGTLGPIGLGLAISGAMDPGLYLAAFLAGGTPGALVGTFLAWRRSRREGPDARRREA